MAFFIIDSNPLNIRKKAILLHQS